MQQQQFSVAPQLHNMMGFTIAFIPMIVALPASVTVNLTPPNSAPAPAQQRASRTAPAASASPAPATAEGGPAPAPAPAARTPAGAGLPAPLVALLRTEGPYLANEVYSVTPPQPLQAIAEPVPCPEWYAITRGRFVGVVDQYALSAIAISGVAHSARKAYTSQSLALDAFNQALVWGGVQVV
ncbi:hypothetical protein B0H15DRAFT_951365 [Mycena belliarum]|uniref:Uncharacterized protein n=1 Tax=Mycena belliarum TaxID=1033014 RepID=A0AAD6XKI2_9AGAR|nr:hypothetical protein B0H15DRAFT_951365 [Mycena belliae]